MASRWLAFLVWALVAGTAVFWLLRIVATPSPVPAHAVAVDTTPSVRSDLSKLMGSDPVESARPETVARADDRFKLVGVAAASGSETARRSVALIAVDGKPPRAFRVGAAIDGDLVLQSVRPKGVDLGPGRGAAAVTLELPPLAPAATGVLPPAATLPGPGGARPAVSPSLPAQAAQVPVPRAAVPNLAVPLPPAAASPPGTAPAPMPGVPQPITPAGEAPGTATD